MSLVDSPAASHSTGFPDNELEPEGHTSRKTSWVRKPDTKQQKSRKPPRVRQQISESETILCMMCAP